MRKRYDNVIICCTIENQENADRKLSVFQRIPAKHKQITAQPLIGPVNMEPYLDGMEAVIVGGTHFIKDGKEYTLQVKDLCRQARLANIDFDT